MAYVNLGQMKISDANEMNVPVHCFLSKPEAEGEMWCKAKKK